MRHIRSATVGDRARTATATIGPMTEGSRPTGRVLITTHHRPSVDSGAAGSAQRIGGRLADRGWTVVHLDFGHLGRLRNVVLSNLLFPWLVAAHLIRHHRRYRVVFAHTGDAWVWLILRRIVSHGLETPIVCRSSGLEPLAHRARLDDDAQLRRRYHLYWGGFRQWEVARSLRQ